MKDICKITQNSSFPRSVTEDRAAHDLMRCIVRGVKGNSLLLTDRNSVYPGIMEKYGAEMSMQDIAFIKREKERSYRSVVLLEVLENHDAEQAAQILENAWDLLEEKGCMIVVVPNENEYSHIHQIRTMDRKILKKVLRPFGRPKIIVEQPFRWLMMSVKKRTRAPGALNRSKASRFHTTVNLCRGKVLEFGCGTGILTNEIHKQGFEVMGVDINAEKIIEARQRYPDTTFIRSDVIQLSLPQESFDTVILPEILEHVPDETGSRMLDIAWRLVRNQGRLIVSVPNENCIPHPNHIRQFDRKYLQYLLSRFGEPVTVSDQPYKWLMMYVEKNRNGQQEL